MSDFLQRLEREILIADGPERLRSQYDQLTEHGGWWALNHPEKFQEIIRAQFEMGCNYTAVNGDDKYTLKKFGVQDKVREIARGTLKLAKEVVPNNCYLAFSILSAPWVPPVDDAGLERLYKLYEERVIIAEDIGVDFYRVMGADIVQTVACVKVIKDNSKAPVVVANSFDPTPKGFRAMFGDDLISTAKALDEAGADVIGISCGGTNYQETTAALREIRTVTDKPLIARPNAGIPELINGKPVHPATPEDMAKEAPNWVAAGARMVSGCCGTTPEHIAKVISVLRK